MIPVSTLYDEYIDRPKLTEPKKKPFEYIVPPPLKRGRNNEKNSSSLRKQSTPMFTKNVQTSRKKTKYLNSSKKDEILNLNIIRLTCFLMITYSSLL